MENLTYSHRLLQILTILAEANDYITLQNISEQIKVSKRTVLRELKNINHFLSKFHLEIISKKGIGYQLKGEEEDKEYAISILEKSMIDSIAFNPELRRERLIAECLQKRNIDKLSYFAYLFNVSEGTISRDLKKIEFWFEKNNLLLIRRQGGGVELSGSEEDIHQAKANFLHSQLVKENVEGYINRNVNFDEYEFFKNQDENSIMSLLNRDILFSVIATLKKISIILLDNITQSSYLGLIIHLTIAIDRIKGNDTIEMDSKLLDKLVRDPLFEQAKEFATYFERDQGIAFPKEEIAYILMHLKGSSVRDFAESNDDAIDSLVNDYDCAIIVKKIIHKFGELTKTDFSDDDELYAGLMAHMKPALNRLAFDLDIRNPLLEQIKSQFDDVFMLSKEVCKILETDKRIEISDDEVGYLTLHFGAALERKKAMIQKNVLLDIGIVCSSGVGISVLLASTIKSSFPVLNNVIPLSIEQILDNSVPKYLDAIVSTLNVDDIGIPIINVNPILQQEDIDKMESEFERVKKIKQRKGIHLSPCVENKRIIDMEIVKHLKHVNIDYSLTKRQLIQKLIGSLDESLTLKTNAIHAIYEREELGVVKLLEREFLLLHASVDGLTTPHITFFRFNNGIHLLDELDKISVGIMMLLPRDASKVQRSTLGSISYYVAEKAEFYAIMQHGNRQDIISYLQTLSDAN